MQRSSCTVTCTVSPRINVHALIFEDALSFRKQVQVSLSTSREITLVRMRSYMYETNEMEENVDQSEFEHACQSALSMNYPYDNDLCQEYEYDFFASFKNRVINIITHIYDGFFK